MELWRKKDILKILMPTFSEKALKLAKQATERYQKLFLFPLTPELYKNPEDFLGRNFVSERSPIVAWGIDEIVLEKSFFWLIKKMRTYAQIKKIFSQKVYAMPHFLIKCEARPDRAISIVVDDDDLDAFNLHRYISKDKLSFVAAYLEGHNGTHLEKFDFVIEELWPGMSCEHFQFDGQLFDALKKRYAWEMRNILFIFHSRKGKPERDASIFRSFPNALIVF